MDIPALFGIQSPQKPDEKMDVAKILMLLLELLGGGNNKRDDLHVQDEREQGSREIPVRPRIEPLGGG